MKTDSIWPENHEAKRKEKRYPVPAVYQSYITLKIRLEEAEERAFMLDFSQNGIGFVSGRPFHKGKVIDCVLSAPRSLSRNVVLNLEVMNCEEINGEFVVGTMLKKVDDELWFELFKETHDYILNRAGEVY